MIYDLIYKIASTYYLCIIANRKDEVLKKYPDWESTVETFAEYDPSGNFKYLEWQINTYLKHSGLAISQIVELIDLFHKYSNKLDKKDIYQYKLDEVIKLYQKLKDIDEQKLLTNLQKQQIQQEIACGNKTIYESENFLVKQIMNKAASVHYGLGTQWCITMKDAAHWEDYEMNNVIFFFIFCKKVKNIDPLYRVAVACGRDTKNNLTDVDLYNAEDTDIDLLFFTDAMEKNYGVKESEINQIFNKIVSIAKAYPKSLLSKFGGGEANQKELLDILKYFENKFKDNPNTKEAEEIYDFLFATYQIPESILKHWHIIIKNINWTEKLPIPYSILYHVAENYNTPTDVLFKLYMSRDSDIQRLILQNPSFDKDSLVAILRYFIKNKLDRNIQYILNHAPPKLLDEISKMDEFKHLFPKNKNE